MTTIFERQEGRKESSVMHNVATYMSIKKAGRKASTPTDYPSHIYKKDRKGNVTKEPATCRLQNVGNIETVKKFFAATNRNMADFIRLSQDEELAGEYVEFLRTFSDGRYGNMDIEGQVILLQWALLVMQWHLCQNKWTGWSALEDQSNPDKDYWANERLRDYFGFCHLVRTRQADLVASLVTDCVKNIVKEPKNQELKEELIEELIKRLFDEIVDKLYIAPIRGDEPTVRDIEENWQRQEWEAAKRKNRKQDSI